MIFRYSLMALTFVAISGCSAFQLRDANQALTSHYQALQNATQSKTPQWRMAEDARASLETLAKDSVEQAEKESDIRNKVAFYRVATVAAWQAESDQLLNYADKGGALCQGENFNKTPRDCSMLMVVPVFAAVDQTTNDLGGINEQIRADTEENRKNYQSQAEKIFANYKNNLNTILSRRESILGSKVHPDFIAALDTNIEDLLCTKLEINGLGLIAKVRGNVPAAQCEVYKTKLSAEATGLQAVCLKTVVEPQQGC